MTAVADRHLLFGLLALQIGLIDQGALVAAFQAWTRDKATALAEHLVARGDLDADDRAAVEALVSRHIKRHDGDGERSLAAVPAGKSTRESLVNLGDPDIGATLGHVASSHGSTEDGDANRTTSYAVGTATSDGQRFRVLRPHARGGLGAVFVALDQELHREVALKQILDRHADDVTSRARFLLEAEVTGGLEHPGIVPVYGLGTYADGRPYYAMRFIRGDSLKEAIDAFHGRVGTARQSAGDGGTMVGDAHPTNSGQRSLELRKLLRRFTDVCNAIDYAHSRGVLHRDIKPGNIIVGKHGETLIVDWGLAKATGRAGSSTEERTLVPSSASGSSETLPGSALGTPAYMSPEQASGDLEHLGPRSDVYSLGATLYCLLTGKPPQEGDDLGEVLRRVQRGEFTRPRQIDALIDAALEAVCLKAMALKPEDRYPTPRLLAEDIERWMADEPVSAWREPMSRRLLRWLSRHRTGVTAAGAALLVALAGTGAVLAVQTRANAELKLANTDLAIAGQRLMQANTDLQAAGERERQRFDLAMEAIKLFHGEVSEDLLLKETQFAGLRAKLLKGAAGFYGKLEGLLKGQSDPQSRASLGQAYFELAEVTSKIGNSVEAEAILRKALAVRRELAERPGADAGAVLDVVRSLHSEATWLPNTGDMAGSQASLEEALNLAEGLVSAGRGADEAKFELASLLYTSTWLGQRRPEERLELTRRALAILRELIAKDPSDSRFLEKLSWCQSSIGLSLDDMGRLAEAIAAKEEALPVFQKLADERPEVYGFQDSLAKELNNLALSLEKMGRLEDAIASSRRAVAVWRKAADANSAVTAVANNLAYGLDNLAERLTDTGRTTEALETLAQARAILRKLVDANLGIIGFPANLAKNYNLSAYALIRIGRWSDAEEAFETGTPIWQGLAKRSKGLEKYLPDSLQRYGWALWRAGRPTPAVAAYGRERAIRQRLCAAEPKNTSYRDALANSATYTAAALVTLGRLAEARACCDRAIMAREDLVKADPRDESFIQGLAESLMRSASVRSASGDAAGAAADGRRAASLYASHPPLRPRSEIFRACCHGLLSGLAGKAGSGIPAAEGISQADEAMVILHQAFAGGYRDPNHLRMEPGLDPLRTRDDFWLLLMDQSFPPEPFAP